MSRSINYTTSLLFAICMCTIVVLFFASPVLLMVISSFDRDFYPVFPPSGLSLKWYTLFFQDVSWSISFLMSVGIALAATLIAVPTASLAAYYAERFSSRASSVLSTFFILPAMLPVIVYAVAFDSTFASWQFFNSWEQVTVAHAVLGLPFVFLIMRAGIASLDRDVESAARTLGAGPLRVTVSIRIPWLKWHIIIAALLAFVVSFTEPVLPIFLSSDETATLPQKMWEGLQHGVDPRATVGIALLIYALLLGILAVTMLRLLQIFRSNRRQNK